MEIEFALSIAMVSSLQPAMIFRGLLCLVAHVLWGSCLCAKSVPGQNSLCTEFLSFLFSVCYSGFICFNLFSIHGRSKQFLGHPFIFFCASIFVLSCLKRVACDKKENHRLSLKLKKA